MTTTTRKFDYYTVRQDQYGGFAVHGFSTYPRDSVLAGQPMKVFLDSFPTLAEAQAAYPTAVMGSKWTDPQVSLNHLPGEDDPVPGGMYPDDIGSVSHGTEALLAMKDDLPWAEEPKRAPVARLAALARAGAEPAHPTEGSQLDPALARAFILAGNATFTVVSRKTGTRFTFKFSRPKDEQQPPSQYPGAVRRKPIFVNVLSGPQNDSDYTYLGQVREDAEKFTYAVGKKSRVAATAPSQVAAMWLTKALNHPEKLAQAEIWHAGKCGRCGRKLTVPESIASGIGPECARMM